jgi:hypothetical protein
MVRFEQGGRGESKHCSDCETKLYFMDGPIEEIFWYIQTVVEQGTKVKTSKDKKTYHLFAKGHNVLLTGLSMVVGWIRLKFRILSPHFCWQDRFFPGSHCITICPVLSQFNICFWRPRFNSESDPFVRARYDDSYSMISMGCSGFLLHTSVIFCLQRQWYPDLVHNP